MKKKVSKLFNNNIFWAVISLLAAIAIWVYMTGTQEEVINKTLSGVRLTIVGEDELQSTRGLVVTDVSAQTVDVTIQGTRLNIGALSADDVQAVIDVSRLTVASLYTQNYTLVYPDGVDSSEVRLLRSSPSSVSFQVTRMDDKSVPVDVIFSGSAAEGYMLGEVEYEPQTIRVSGPASVLETVESVQAEVALEDMDATRTVDAPYILLDADGNEVSKDGLEFDYDTISVTIPISKMRDVPLYVTLVEGAGATRANTDIKLSVEEITIAGDASEVDALNRIEIGPVDLTDFALTYEETLDIVLPNGIENVSGVEEVTVSIEVTGLSVREFVVTDINFAGLPDGYAAELITQSLTVRVRGREAVLDALTSANISVTADLSNTTATGTMDTSNVRVTVDGALDAGAVGTYRLTFNISR